MNCPQCGATFTQAQAADSRRQKVIALRQEGKSITQIAQAFGISKATVHADLRGSGLETIGLKPGPP